MTFAAGWRRELGATTAGARGVSSRLSACARIRSHGTCRIALSSGAGAACFVTGVTVRSCRSLTTPTLTGHFE
jgi:hypothetical protein